MDTVVPDERRYSTNAAAGARQSASEQQPIRNHRPVADSEGWRERARHMWALMPERLQTRVIDKLIYDNPRVFWMTIIALLDAEQQEKDQDQAHE